MNDGAIPKWVVIDALQRIVEAMDASPAVPVPEALKHLLTPPASPCDHPDDGGREQLGRRNTNEG